MKKIKLFRQKLILIFVFQLALFSHSSAQWECNLGSFEDSTWGSWKKKTYSRLAYGNQYLQDYIDDRAMFSETYTPYHFTEHMITNSGTYDTLVNSLTTVPPVTGRKHAVRLGNRKGTKTNMISVTTTVTSECFSFWYALVFTKVHEDHPNDREGEPFFMFRIRNVNEVVIPEYTYIKVSNERDTPFFKQSPSDSRYIYSDWQHYQVDMKNYIGQQVTIEFITADCNRPEDHGGYAYLDNICFGSCCATCKDLFNFDPQDFVGTTYYRTISESYRTATDICYKVGTLRFDREIFKCPPFGMRIFDLYAPQHTYWEFKQPGIPVMPGIRYNLQSLEFCVKKSDFVNGEKRLGIEFTNAKGEVICTLKDTLGINFCCDSIAFIREPDAAGGECTGNIFVGIPEHAPCGIVDIRTSHPSVPVFRNNYQVGYTMKYQLYPLQTDTYIAYFVNSKGDTVCNRQMEIHCPGVSCCGALQVELKHHTVPELWHPCCYQYNLNINPLFRCPEVFTIREQNGDTLLQGNNIMNTIPPLGSPALRLNYFCSHNLGPVTRMLELADFTGRVICTIPLEVPGCSYPLPESGGPGSKNGSHEEGEIQELNSNRPDQYLQLLPNPADRSVTITIDNSEDIPSIVKIIDVAGKMVYDDVIYHTKTLNTMDWAEGIYFVKLVQKGNSKIYRFIVNH